MKKPVKAEKIFFVRCGKISLRVRVFKNIYEVNSAYKKEHHDGSRIDKKGEMVNAFFCANNSPNLKRIGTITLASNGDLFVIIPHEVTHAVLHFFKSVHELDDEPFATAVGELSSRIYKHIAKHWYVLGEKP
jgi:hypothetical protein